MTKDTSGPVFPVHGGGQSENWNGISLRDYFAAQAMRGLFNAPGRRRPDSAAIFAKEAYELADAMIEARK